MVIFCSATILIKIHKTDILHNIHSQAIGEALHAHWSLRPLVNLTAVVSGSDQFMSFCLICLVAARESNFPASAGLFGYSKSEWFFAITLISTWFQKYSVNKRFWKTEDTLYKFVSPWHRPICGLFFSAKNQSIRTPAYFSMAQAPIYETLSPLLLLVWVTWSSIPKMILRLLEKIWAKSVSGKKLSTAS